MKCYPSMVKRLIGWQIAAMAFAWVFLLGSLAMEMLRFENGDLDKRMSYFAQLLAETASTARSDEALLKSRLGATEQVFVQGVIETLDGAGQYEATYQVFDSAGRMIYRTANAPALAFAASDGISERKIVADGDSKAADTWRIARVTSLDKTVSVVVAESSRTRWLSIWPMLRIIGTWQLIVFASCVIVLWWAARRGMRPLYALAAQMSRRAAGDLSPISNQTTVMETAPIVNELNALLDRESRRLENERGFLADASHELRTPLAAIGNQAHLLIDAKSETERAAARAELQRGLERVSHLLTQLLTIARFDAVEQRATRERLNVAELVRDRLATLAESARQHVVELSFDAPDELFFMVNRGAFISLVDNLVDNAIRYTPHGGHVDVSLGIHDGALALQVRDDGPGIAPAERERVFERFYRIPGTAAAGTGLGLAIVRKVVQSHEATLQFIDGLGNRGIGIEVKLPVTL